MPRPHKFDPWKATEADDFKRQTNRNHTQAVKKAAERAQFIAYMTAKEEGHPVLNTFQDAFIH